jgi:3-phosphoshikimate 1-carboxyvinyltransferase
MALPDLIEIVPLTRPVRAEITVPGSKSITNRALILAALADGETILRGALWSEDTQIMVACLQQLGFQVNVEPDPAESCNRTITVKGLGGKIPNGGTAGKPLELFVGNAGTSARFLAAFVCLGHGVYRLSGVPRMHERPQAALFSALRELGYRVESENGNDKLPVKIFGGSSRGNEAQTEKTEISQSLLTSAATKKCRVSIAESSQFASALRLCAKTGSWKIEITGENADESPYVVMTDKMVEAFPQHGGTFQIEPDASSGSYFWAAGCLLVAKENSIRKAWGGKWSVAITNWPKSDWQIDSNFADHFTKISDHSPNFEKAIEKKERIYFQQFQKDTQTSEFVSQKVQLSRQLDLGDSIMTAIAISPLAVRPIHFTDLARLRVQECERVAALRTELTKCGAKVVEEGDTLTVYPAKPEDLHGAEIETYNDHRMAMCFAILGLKVPGIRIKNPSCVKKTFPNFFQKLAAPPPHGLGAEIWEIQNGRRTRQLSGEDLFAD